MTTLSASFGAAIPMPKASEITVRHASRAQSHRDSVDRTYVGERTVAFLRARHPHKTADNVAADTGIPSGTVQKMLDRGTAPRADHYCRLWLAYGPEFLAATIERAPAWLDAAHRAEEAARLRSEIAAREAELARLTR